MSDSLNNLLSKYLNQYKKNPRSRVFAPLAETYRKIGMLDEALKTLKEGLKFHSNYQLALLVLGNCYYDMQEFNKSYEILKPITEKHVDNLKLYQLFAEVCLKLSLEDEALNAFKNVLFLNPYSEEAAVKVAELEESSKLKEKFEIIHDESSPLAIEQTVEEDWVAIDLSQNETNETVQEPLSEEDQLDNWAMNKDNLTDKEPVKELVKDSIPAADDGVESVLSEEDEPFVTHTLVDIYIAQKHYPKAKDLLEKIIEADPNDEKSRNKLEQVMAKLGDQPESYYKRLEKKYLGFLAKIRARAEIYTRA